MKLRQLCPGQVLDEKRDLSTHLKIPGLDYTNVTFQSLEGAGAFFRDCYCGSMRSPLSKIAKGNWRGEYQEGASGPGLYLNGPCAPRAPESPLPRNFPESPEPGTYVTWSEAVPSIMT